MPILSSQTTDRIQIACWVAECVLSKEDSRRRAAIVKHLITVADVCCQKIILPQHRLPHRDYSVAEL